MNIDLVCDATKKNATFIELINENWITTFQSKALKLIIEGKMCIFY